ncbi:MAG TPA: S41 family peptidase [Usitatibacter sp.]|jgi:carboxyl-terminal processing protease|nr:S41 family peptidase [Usitatibacter sp.]
MIRFLRPVVPVAALLLAAGCSILDPYNMIGRQWEEQSPQTPDVVPAGNRPLSPEARERAFEFVWNTINEHYHDANLNGVDWRAVRERYHPLAMAAPGDDAFWDVLDRMTGELHDSHTRVESPRRVALRKRDELISLGFTFMPIEGRLAVVSVNPESDAWWAGLRPGMTLVSIDGEAAEAAYQRLMADTRFDSTDRSRNLRVVRRLITGEPDTSVAFTFERSDGSRFDTVLKRRKVTSHPGIVQRILPSGVAYLRISQWTFTVVGRALTALEGMQGAPGLIIDLRGNPGGSVYTVNQMLERFFTRPTELGRATTRSGEPVSLFFGAVEIIRLHRRVPGDPNAYRGPVVVLVDALSASGSELFAGTMQAAGRALVVGQPSCGCLLGFLGYAYVPGGAELAYSEVGFIMSNGKHIEGEGVIPDEAVPLTLADLRVGRDRTLERAQELVRTAAPRAR